MAEGQKVYVVWDTVHEEVVAVFSTEEKASDLTYRLCEEKERQGVSYPYTYFAYDEFIVDGPPRGYVVSGEGG